MAASRSVDPVMSQPVPVSVALLQGLDSNAEQPAPVQPGARPGRSTTKAAPMLPDAAATAKIKRVMAATRDPSLRALMVKQHGTGAAAGVLTYFGGLGGIRTLPASRLTKLDFYFNAPHARNLEVMTSKALRGATPSLPDVPAKVRALAPGQSFSYPDRADALADGFSQVNSMGQEDQAVNRLIGGWTISDIGTVKVSRVSSGAYEVSVSNMTVAIDKYDWNTKPGDQARITFTKTPTGEPVYLSHADMEAAKQFGAKDFWLTGAVATVTRYNVPAVQMNQMLAGQKLEMKQFKVSEIVSEVKGEAEFRKAMTRAYVQNARGARSAPVPPANERIRAMEFPK